MNRENYEDKEVLNAKQIMKTEIQVASPWDSIQKLVLRMGQQKFSGLPVVDEEGSIIGVVSELDLLRAYHEDRSDDPVGKLMSTDVITVDEQTQLAEIVDLFLTNGIRRVFVAEQGQLRGVISRRDVLLAVDRENLSGTLSRSS